jgi:membrane fusion protein (multidrug efflux system)
MEEGESKAHMQRTRRRGLAWLAFLVGLFAAGWWISELLVADTVATDNAYVQGNVVVVTPQVAGTVLSIQAEETHRVEAGQVLVSLDATDAGNTLKHKAARLARVVRETRAMYPKANTLRSTLAIRQSAVKRARMELVHSEEKLERRQALQASGVLPREELQDAKAHHDAAQSELAAAESSVEAAREELKAQLALTTGVVIQRHPMIEEAAVEMREAWLAVKRCQVRAPLAGYIARRNVQIGQRVGAGAALMSIVALDKLWVEANFKENQLRDVRIGQPASLTADLYGQDVVYKGQVVGIGIGTGSAFALLPPQNATGNWIKILQRVPVRIALDPKTLAEHPLRLGLSMRVVVDTRNRSGPMLSIAAQEIPAVETKIFDSLSAGAEEAVQEVIDANLNPEPQQSAGVMGEGSSSRP